VRQCAECSRCTSRIIRGLCPACYQKWMRVEGRIGARSSTFADKG
jgi:hypothetical protein